MQTFASVKKEVITIRNARKVFELIADEMKLVEKEFVRQLSSNVQVIDYLGEYLRSSGGKRLRPALVLLADHAAGGRPEREALTRMAAVMEMLHMATLVHDDIIDNADVRRGKPSFNARFGNHSAVLMGDWLYMSAFETSLQQRSLEVLDILTRLTRKMTEGELIQLTAIGKHDITEDEYFDILRRKTAYLFSGCCEIGAILGNASGEEQAALKDFGMDLGIAFQLVDDLLDFTSDRAVMGKAAAADLVEGKVTLPLIKYIQATPSAAADIQAVMAAGSYTDGFASDLSSRLESDGHIRQVKEIANNYARSARKNLEILPQNKYRDALAAITDFVTARDR